jgi:hypothetical protein
MEDRFIPVRFKELARTLGRDFYPEDEERSRFLLFARLFEDLIEYEACEAEERLKSLYAPFDPDADTVTLAEHSPEKLRSMEEEFYLGLREMFQKANYSVLDPRIILNGNRRNVHWGLNIDPRLDALSHLDIFFRGKRTEMRPFRSLSTLFRRREKSVTLYRRVGVVVRPRGSAHIFLKLFKEIAHEDLEVVIPTIKLKMTLPDKFKLSGSGGAALYSIARIAATAKAGLLWLGPMILGLGVFYGAKTFLGYKHMKEIYLKSLAHELYYKSLDNNTGVLTRLTDLICEEDLKEAVLAFHFIRSMGTVPGEEVLKERAETGSVAGEGDSPEADLKRRVEAYLRERFRVEVNFEVHDALAKLQAKGILLRHAGGIRVKALKPAIEELDRIWDTLYTPKKGAP